MFKLKISKYISIPVFLASFLFGLFFLYIWGSDLHPIYVHPTPENVYKIVYKDKSDTCYVYKPIITDCTSKSKPHQIQQ